MAQSNYDIMRDDAARLFAQTDHSSAAARFGLQEQDGWLTLEFFGFPYRVSTSTGVAQRLVNGAWETAGYNDAMTIYDLLGYSQPTCHAGGQMINTRSLHIKMASTAPSTTDLFARHGTLLGEHLEQLPAAFEAMGGTALKRGDASARFTVFADLKMQVQVWAADEDFPATVELFWDENVLQYMHYETVWYANGFILNEIEAQVAPDDPSSRR